MAVSKAQQKAVSKYMKNNYDDLRIRIRKDDKINKAVITESAKQVNESVNEFVIKAVKQRIENNK